MSADKRIAAMTSSTAYLLQLALPEALRAFWNTPGL
jgi:hypothetical protein